MSGGGVGGRMYAARAAADAGDVANERNAAVGIEVAHVMRGMSRRISDIQLPTSHRDSFLTFQDPEAVGGNRQEVSPEPFHVLAIQA